TYKYKGIRSGAFINSKDDRISYSTVSSDFKTVQNRRGFTAAEIAFLKAEAALRGWANAGDAKTNYENGVRLSFSDWGAAGVDAYLADATSKPINYIDPKDAKNNFTALSTITVAWNAGDSNELKLEKIITQKYLSTFTNTLEAWVDFRRTGYPKIPHVAKNDSSPDWGIITADQWIKRLVYVPAERTGNAAAVSEASTFLTSGKDDIASRLWWDTTTTSNF
ncbi:MAG: SusD/RagB family nutrient-binding outer membrane lipoprotein, partial [Pedobacter sp.]